MENGDGKDTPKSMDQNALNNSAKTEVSVATPKKRVSQGRFRQIPDYYFLPRRSWSYRIGIYGSLIAAGIGGGMLLEVWINKKIQEDGGVVWEFDKK